jgi:hypothetical protein
MAMRYCPGCGAPVPDYFLPGMECLLCVVYGTERLQPKTELKLLGFRKPERERRRGAV